MSFNILRTKKINSRIKITQAAEHNFRLRLQHNIDPSRTKFNRVVVNSLGVDEKIANDFQNKLSDFYSSLGIKERADNVLMMEFVVSASPDFFTGKKESEILEWVNHQVDFMKKEFGDQLKLAIYHRDEKSPHIHFMIGTEMKSVKKYKNQKGEFHKETWSLNAKRYNPEFLSALHDRHAEWNKKYGLKRGVKGSAKKNNTVKQFYSALAKALNTNFSNEINPILAELKKESFLGRVPLKSVLEKFSPMLNKLLLQDKVLETNKQLTTEQLVRVFDEVSKEREKIKELKPIYKDAINSKIADSKLIADQQTKIESLEIENSELKRKFQVLETSKPMPVINTSANKLKNR